MDLGLKAFYIAIAIVVGAGVVFIAMKIGELMVKRRTKALLDEHGGDDDDAEGPRD